MNDTEIAYLEGVVSRSTEQRKTCFGMRKTTKAEAAEMILVAYAPYMLQEIKKLRHDMERAIANHSADLTEPKS